MKNIRLEIRLTEYESRQLEKEAVNRGMTKSELIRFLSYSKPTICKPASSRIRLKKSPRQLSFKIHQERERILAQVIYV